MIQSLSKSPSAGKKSLTHELQGIFHIQTIASWLKEALNKWQPP
jgi:hypothetical protein